MELIKLTDITVDPEIQLQTRGVDQDTVSGYVEAMANGDQFPPVTIYDDGETLWLSAGFHRVSAYRFLGLAEIEADVRKGTRNDAMIDAATDNKAGTRPMSRAQKEEAGKRLITLTDWTDVKIASEVAVDRSTVSKWRPSCEISHDTRTVTRNGTTYQMNTANIGQQALVDTGEPYTPSWLDDVNGHESSGIEQCPECRRQYNGDAFGDCPYCFREDRGIGNQWVEGLPEMYYSESA